MTKYSFLGAVVLAASALASPAMAQQVIYNPGYCAQFYPNANCQNLGPGNPYTGSYQRRAAYQQNYNRWDTGNPYTRGYQQRVAYQPTGWNTSYNRWDTGNPYTRGYQRRVAYQPTGWNAAGTQLQSLGHWKSLHPRLSAARRLPADRLEQQLQPLGHWKSVHPRLSAARRLPADRLEGSWKLQPLGHWRSRYQPAGLSAASRPAARSYQQTTAPYAAVDNGYRRGYYGQSYAQQSGLVCTPGTRYRGEDGRRHLCQ